MKTMIKLFARAVIFVYDFISVMKSLFIADNSRCCYRRCLTCHLDTCLTGMDARKGIFYYLLSLFELQTAEPRLVKSPVLEACYNAANISYLGKES